MAATVLLLGTQEQNRGATPATEATEDMGVELRPGGLRRFEAAPSRGIQRAKQAREVRAAMVRLLARTAAPVAQAVAEAFGQKAQGHNVVGDTTGTSGLGASGDLLNVDARIDTLADNGGPTWTCALLTDSPAINAGATAGAAAVDQRGVSRPQGTAVDIGAFEFEGATITGIDPPTPTVVEADGITLCATASGPEPLTYQWQFNGTNILFATEQCYAIPLAHPADEGDYAIVVSNPAGSVTSAVVTLTVRVPAHIVQSPTNATALEGEPASFSVVAEGDPELGYQWYFQSNPISGATSSAYSIAAVQTNQAGSYQVVVSNAWGSATSAVTTLAVLAKPVITQSPVSLILTQGNRMELCGVAMGALPLSYQWQKDGLDLAGATNACYAVDPVESSHWGSYRVVVTNLAGAATSGVAVVTVLVPAAIAVSPTNQNVLQGGSVNLCVEAVGTPPLTYQWRKGDVDLLNAGNVSGIFTDTLMLSNVTTNDRGGYTVVVRNLAGSATSAPPAVLTVLVPPTILVQPKDQSVLVGGTAQFDVVADGTPPLSYQWWSLSSGLLSDATNSTLLLTNVQPTAETYYRVEVSNVAGTTLSLPALLSVEERPLLLRSPAVTDGVFMFEASVVPGQAYAVEASTNLTDWILLLTTNATADSVAFNQTEPYQHLQRFYRVRIWP